MLRCVVLCDRTPFFLPPLITPAVCATWVRALLFVATDDDGSHVGMNIPRVPRDVDSYLEQLRASRPEAALIMVTEDGVVKGRVAP